MFYRNDKYVTVHNKCPQIPPPNTTHFATRGCVCVCVWRSCDVRLSWSSRFFMPGSNMQNASEQFACCIQLHFHKLRYSSGPTRKIPTDSNATFTQLYLGNHSQLYTYRYELAFSEWRTLIHAKILTFRPESPYTKFETVVWVTRRNVWHSKHAATSLRRLIHRPSPTTHSTTLLHPQTQQ